MNRIPEILAALRDPRLLQPEEKISRIADAIEILSSEIQGKKPYAQLGKALDAAAP